MMIGATNVFTALSGKQDALTFTAPAGGIGLISFGDVIKNLKAAAPVTMTQNIESSITVGIKNAPAFTGKVTMDEIKAASTSGISVYRNTDAKVLDLGTDSYSVDVTGPARITGDLSCASLSGDVLLQVNPYHVAGRIASSAVQSSKGRYGFTVTKLSTGIFQIDFSTAHPNGANFIAAKLGKALVGT